MRPITKFEKLAEAYAQIGSEFRDIGNAKLVELVDTWEKSLAQMHSMLIKNKPLVKRSVFVAGLEQGLREIPSLLSERAKTTPYGGTIAHGFLTLSLLTKFLEDLMHVKSMEIGMNYGLNKVRFMRPVPSGSRVRMKATLADVEDYRGNGVKATLNTLLEVENSRKPVCVAEWMILLFQ